MSDVKIFTDIIDPKAQEQINDLTRIPAFVESKIRIMPDVHAGMGCVIGFTADLGDKVIPNIVGVDIGCGMYTINLGKVPIDFHELDRVVRENIPSGMNVHDTPKKLMPEVYEMLCARKLHHIPRLMCSIGTLGGGNHFIEVDVSDDGTQYLVIHTGSRNLGKQVAELYQQHAIGIRTNTHNLAEQCEALISQLKAEGRHSEIQREVTKLKKDMEKRYPDILPALCYLEGESRERYLHDMRICQAFATLNRATIAKILQEKMGWDELDAFHTIHNYIDHDSNIVRKGAISARLNEKLLIPINMRDGAILGKGKGNDDWNQSAPHGAGRLMGRMEAKRRLNLQEFQTTMQGVYTTSVSAETLDEAPMAYKSMKDILAKIGDTVDVQAIIKPAYNFKASD